MPNKDNCPLSLEGWIKLYTDEINKVEMQLFQLENHGNDILLKIFLGGLVAAVIKLNPIDELLLKITLKAIVIILVIMILFVFYEFKRKSQIKKKLKSLINTREAIISGNLVDYEKIKSKWEAYMKEYYGKYLEKTKMNKTENESREPPGDPQVSQSDISHIKESLQEIKDMLEGTKIFSVLATLGSFLIAISIFMISLCTTLLVSKDYYAGSIVLIIGTLVLFSGSLMFSSAQPYIGDLKELWHDNFLFRLAIYVLGIAILILYLSILIVIFFF